jgi:hypothetical protein
MDELTMMLVAILGGIDVAMVGKPGGAFVSSSSSCRNANLWFFFPFLVSFLVTGSLLPLLLFYPSLSCMLFSGFFS